MANFMQLEIRKLRKKLRQIEILERQDRNLNEEENEKVSRKEILRHELLHLLAQYPDEDKLPDEELNEEVAIVNTSPEHDEKVDTSTAIENTFPEHDDKVDISTEILNTSPENDDNVDTLTKGTSEISRQFDELAMKRNLRSTGLGHSLETAPCKKIKREQNEPIASTSGTTPSNETQQKKQTALNKIKELRKSWENVSFLVRSLKGHNDLVTCAAIDNTLLVTGSRDTTIKVWNADTGIEEQSLRGHTSVVTCLVLLKESDSKILCAAYDNSRIIISGSQDCCVNVWSAKGIKINSMYTYNAVVSIGYISQAQLIVVGSESGKLELWEPLSGMNLQSFKAYEDPVTCLKVLENEVVTSGGDGVVKIWYLHLQQLRLVTNSEMIRSAQGRFVTQRYIRCLTRTKNKVYYGDDGVNIKVWNIKRGIVLKLRNHLGEFGTTDTICDIDDLIISSSYNMDSGYSYLNVRALPFDNYLASFDDRSTHRIMALVATRKEPDLLRLVTAGQELKIWNLIRKRPVPKEEAESFTVVEPHLMPNLIQAADDSDSEIYSEDSESEDYDEESKFNEMSIYKPTFYKRWCCIL